MLISYSKLLKSVKILKIFNHGSIKTFKFENMTVVWWCLITYRKHLVQFDRELRDDVINKMEGRRGVC